MDEQYLYTDPYDAYIGPGSNTGSNHFNSVGVGVGAGQNTGAYRFGMRFKI